MNYFTIPKLTASAKASELKIDNNPPPEAIENLCRLVDKLLDPIKELWGKPITVTSGFRCAELNSAVGGVANSQHLRGEAVDITTHQKELNKQLFQMILDSELEFDQLIEKRDYSFIHLSYSTRNRKQVLHIKK